MTKWRQEQLRLENAYARAMRIWQLNPKYKREKRWVFLNGTELVTQKFTTWSRAKIWSGLARLNFLHEYAKKNYLNK